MKGRQQRGRLYDKELKNVHEGLRARFGGVQSVDFGRN